MPGRFLNFGIIFDNPNIIYYPGQVLSGRVLVELEDTLHTKDLFVCVIGEGIARWTEAKKNVLYDREKYIDDKIPLHKGDERILSAGVHSFIFSYDLPHLLPSTFLGKYGWVQFYCEATIEDVYGDQVKSSEVFIVVNPIDLNMDPLIATPLFRDAEQTLGWFCLNSGPVSCTVKINRRGFVPGESIEISAEIINYSKTTIKTVQAMLVETITYFAKKRVTVDNQELAQIQRGKIKPGETQIWQNQLLQIPKMPPTNLKGSNVIKIQHEVYFVVNPSGFKVEIKLKLPIIIGTSPIQNSFRRQNGYSSYLPEPVDQYRIGKNILERDEAPWHSAVREETSQDMYLY